MTKLQIFVVLSAILLFFALYFGFDTVPSEQKSIEATRVSAQTSTTITNLLREAKQDIAKSATAATLRVLEQQVELAENDSAKIAAFEALSSAWYKQEEVAIAGFYAQELASIGQSETAWSIAGTTYAICVQRDEREKVKQFCRDRAVESFESAISLNPSSVQHQLNLALVYTEHPPQENPMKGILMMLDLNKKNPDDVLVLFNLARLGMQTGQYEKAANRLERAYSLAPEKIEIACMLAEAYQKLNRTQDAESMAAKCQGL